MSAKTKYSNKKDLFIFTKEAVVEMYSGDTNITDTHREAISNTYERLGVQTHFLNGNQSFEGLFELMTQNKFDSTQMVLVVEDPDQGEMVDAAGNLDINICSVSGIRKGLSNVTSGMLVC